MNLDELDYGEGKTRDEEAHDSMVMVGLLFLIVAAAVVAIAVAAALAAIR